MTLTRTDPLDRIFGFDPAATADPFTPLRELQERDPVHWHVMSNGIGVWNLTRYADTAAVLSDPNMSADRGSHNYTETILAHTPEAQRDSVVALRAVLNLWMLMRDAPDQTRLRGLVMKAFTPRVVAAMRPRIQQVVDELLDAVQAAGTMDVIQDFAYPLPTTVIAELLGVPAADRDRIKGWSADITRYLSDPTEANESWHSMEAMQAYLRDICAIRRAQPGDDLLSALLAAEDGGDRLSEAELFANCVLLLWAGHETTTNLIGNGLLALLHHPDALHTLTNDPSLMPIAIEEMLRYDGPVQILHRFPREDCEIGGQRIAAGQSVRMWLNMANRDPAQFPHADTLDLTRTPNRHIAFGHGVHFCLGAALARMEGHAALTTLLRRLPDLRRAGDVQWQPVTTFHAMERFPIAFA